MNILLELSELEIEMLKQGLLARISDYCFSYDEEKSYLTLLDKLNEVNVKEC